MKNNELREKLIKAEYKGFMRCLHSHKGDGELEMIALIIKQEIDARVNSLKAELVRGLEKLRPKACHCAGGDYICEHWGRHETADEAIELVKKI